MYPSLGQSIFHSCLEFGVFAEACWSLHRLIMVWFQSRSPTKLEGDSCTGGPLTHATPSASSLRGHQSDMTRGEQFPMSLWLMRSLAAGTLLFENCQEPGEYMEIVSNVLTKQPLVKPRYTPGRFGPVITSCEVTHFFVGQCWQLVIRRLCQSRLISLCHGV